MYVHTVQKNDTLAGIAKQYTGNEQRLIELVQANPHKHEKVVGLGGVGTDLEPIYVGEKLFLPESWTVGVGAPPLASLMNSVLHAGAAAVNSSPNVINNVVPGTWKEQMESVWREIGTIPTPEKYITRQCNDQNRQMWSFHIFQKSDFPSNFPTPMLMNNALYAISMSNQRYVKYWQYGNSYNYWMANGQNLPMCGKNPITPYLSQTRTFSPAPPTSPTHIFPIKR